MANLSSHKTMLSGRNIIKKKLLSFLNTGDSELIAMIGRRRVGKTFLIKKIYEKNLTFSMTGISDASKKLQLENFATAYKKHADLRAEIEAPSSWFKAFELLKTFITSKRSRRKQVIFFDEFPWLASHRSGFQQAFDHFWNSWAVDQNLVVVICGSAATWMIKNIVNTKGGLHNRVTRTFNLEPFTLAETELFFKDRNIDLPKYDIISLYMALGGIPFYLREVQSGDTAITAIDRLCFGRSAPLKNEFQNLYRALFTNYEDHILVIRALATKRRGLTRKELIKLTGISSGGGFSMILRELEESSFITKYEPYDKVERGTTYRLTDFFSYFYLSFMENKPSTKGTWAKKALSQGVASWKGYTFENVCYMHSDSIKEALGIIGVQTEESSFIAKEKNGIPGVQVDLLIDRADNAINICEAKFYNADYTITKDEAAKLRNRKSYFQQHSRTRKQVILTMVTTYGITENMYRFTPDITLTMETLFLEKEFNK